MISNWSAASVSRATARATNMAWRMPFPPSRIPASIEFSIKLFVCLSTYAVAATSQWMNAGSTNVLVESPLSHCFWQETRLKQSLTSTVSAWIQAPASDGVRRCSSAVLQAHPWLWQFGREKTRLGGLTVEETAKRLVAKYVDRKKREAETCQRRKADRAGRKIEACLVHVRTS